MQELILTRFAILKIPIMKEKKFGKRPNSAHRIQHNSKSLAISQRVRPQSPILIL